MNGTKTESWSMNKIATALKDKEMDNVRIEVPTFQRNIVWKPKQKEAFIDSVKKGFPVGTLLFYKRKDGEVYSLIDGLQRSSTILDFIDNPTHYFGAEDISAETIGKMYEWFESKSTKQDFEDAVSKEIETFMGMQTDLNRSDLVYDLVDLLIDKYSWVEKSAELHKSVFKEISPTINNFKKTYNEIAESTVPILIYSGDESFLPTIFERINNQGTQLSKYQIYAASWAVRNYMVKVEKDEVLKHVIEKYDAFTEEGYVLQDYDKEEMLASKQLTVFEYVLGFGKYISSKYTTLFIEDKQAQNINQIGFELLNACFGHHTTEIKTLDVEIHKLNDLTQFQNCVEDSIKWVANILKPIIEFKGNKRDTITYFHSHFQIISMIASVFREKYDIPNLPYERVDWKQKEEILKQNIPQYYVYDILTRVWTESGQGKIFSILNEDKYLEKIDKALWETKLNDWFKTMSLYQEKMQVPNPKAMEKLFLNCIYMTKFSSKDQLSRDNFDVEHLVPKNYLKQLIKKYSWEGLPISCIGNLCLLPEYDNRLKQDNTIYNDEKYITYLTKEKDCTIEMVENKYSFTKKADLEWCNEDFRVGDYERIKKYYMVFLNDHFKKMKNAFYDSMEIK